MAGEAWHRVSLPDAVLEVTDSGSGEPVLLIQTALTADELLPLADHPALQDRFRVIAHHRRGYGRSSPVRGPGSVERDALDCRALLDALRVERAHVVGLSYSGAVALQLAAAAPGRVHSLCLVEPPPLHVPGADEFVAACVQLVEEHRQHGRSAALDHFLTLVVGPDWRHDLERLLPGATAQAERDADTFFATDLPALLSWRFGPEDTRRLDQPVLYVGGTASGPWFAEVHELMLSWFPRAEDVMLTGADHNLALTHTGELAGSLATFLRRHPI
jgi:pimeloyl-ACP methyl ester carboxylesterase